VPIIFPFDGLSSNSIHLIITLTARYSPVKDFARKNSD